MHLKELHDYFKNIINDNTIKYLEKYDFWPVSNYFKSPETRTKNARYIKPFCNKDDPKVNLNALEGGISTSCSCCMSGGCIGKCCMKGGCSTCCEGGIIDGGDLEKARAAKKIKKEERTNKNIIVENRKNNRKLLTKMIDLLQKYDFIDRITHMDIERVINASIRNYNKQFNANKTFEEKIAEMIDELNPAYEKALELENYKEKEEKNVINEIIPVETIKSKAHEQALEFIKQSEDYEKKSESNIEMPKKKPVMSKKIKKLIIKKMKENKIPTYSEYYNKKIKDNRIPDFPIKKNREFITKKLEKRRIPVFTGTKREEYLKCIKKIGDPNECVLRNVRKILKETAKSGVDYGHTSKEFNELIRKRGY